MTSRKSEVPGEATIDMRDTVRARELQRHDMLLKKQQNFFVPGVDALTAEAAR